MPTKSNTPKLLPSVVYLRECFHYDRETGVLTWRHRPRSHFIKTKEWMRWNTRYAGTVAGNVKVSGHLALKIDKVEYRVHRITWKLETGEEPPPNIDHKRGDKTDNRFASLREAPSQVEQARNTTTYSNNTSGYRGVQWHHTKWRAGIRIEGVWQSLGRFDTREEAAAAYDAAARKLFGEFYRES